MVKSSPKNQVHISPDRCKGCGFCIEFCPLGILKPSPNLNRAGFHYPEVRFPEKCSGCEMCAMVCPDFSIWIEKGKSAKAQV